MNPARPLMVLLAAGFLVACAATEPRPNLTPASGPPAARAMPVSGQGCPFGVRGAKVSIENVSRGVILTFVVPSDAGVEALREQVKNVAAQHGPGAHMGPGHDGEHGSGDGHGIHFSDMPPVETTFQPIDGGARLHVLANEPSDVRAVQTQMWSRVEHLAAGQCR